MGIHLKKKKSFLCNLTVELVPKHHVAPPVITASWANLLEWVELILHLIVTATLNYGNMEQRFENSNYDLIGLWSETLQNLISDMLQVKSRFPPPLLQFHVIASYPRVWNMPQSWQCEIEVYKATYHFIYAQKNFFTGESCSRQSQVKTTSAVQDPKQFV